MAKLTDKQQRFCQEYIADMNATQAAIRAGYTARSAQQIGSENLLKPLVKAEIERLLADRQQKTGYNRIRAEQELERIHQRALEKGDLASAVTAVREKKKLFGLDQEDKTLTLNVKPILTAAEERVQLMERLSLLDEADDAGDAIVRG
jgi:single-stranded DNA-specific DHH superfamily exonuclease